MDNKFFENDFDATEYVENVNRDLRQIRDIWNFEEHIKFKLIGKDELMKVIKLRSP